MEYLSFLKNLVCTRCGRRHDANVIHNLCTCGAPLFPLYDLEGIRERIDRTDFKNRMPHLWRYFDLLPIKDWDNVITLGEGWTPLLEAKKLSKQLGLKVYIKDEGQNPTGTFKARGLSVAMSKAKEFGIKEVAIPSAGNAAGALVFYGRKGGMRTHVFMPKTTPLMIRVECAVAGADVRLVEGSIADAGKAMRSEQERYGWFDVSTFKEPYRVEGKKTMGLELVEQMGWSIPDAIIYPTGGGTGLIGMWKAFKEMEELGWIGIEKPKMISVQSSNCAPVVKAYKEGKESCETWPNPWTIAAGLNVPKPLADFLILKTIRESHGTAISVSDNQILTAVKSLAKLEGVFACPEGAATLAGLRDLMEQNLLEKGQTVVLFNTGTGFKYIEVGRQITSI